MKIYLSPRKLITHNGRCALCERVTLLSRNASNPLTLKMSDEGAGRSLNLQQIQSWA